MAILVLNKTAPPAAAMLYTMGVRCITHTHTARARPGTMAAG